MPIAGQPSSGSTLVCNAGTDVIFGAFGSSKNATRCGKPAQRVCVTSFPGDPGLIENYCLSHIKDLQRDGHRVKPC